MNRHNLFNFDLKPARMLNVNPLLDRGAILPKDQQIESGLDENFLAAMIPGVELDTLSASGSVGISNYRTNLDTTSGALAFTLADGKVRGQIKKVQMTVQNGDATLTVVNFVNGSTITFSDVGDYAVLQWTKLGWVALEIGNEADGVTAPVIA